MILLDTRTLYWFLTDSGKLPDPVKRTIEKDSRVFVSSLSF